MVPLLRIGLLDLICMPSILVLTTLTIWDKLIQSLLITKVEASGEIKVANPISSLMKLTMVMFIILTP